MEVRVWALRLLLLVSFLPQYRAFLSPSWAKVSISHRNQGLQHRYVSVPLLARPSLLRMGETQRVDALPPAESDEEDEEEDDESIDISHLTDHAADAQALGDFVSGWLHMSNGVDPTHATIGEKVALHYRTLREEGWNELGELALEIGDRLQAFFDFPEDGPVCPWDIAYCIYDALRAQADTGTMPRSPRPIVKRPNNVVTREEAKCLEIRKDFMEEVIDNYRSMIDRFRLLRDFFDGIVSWDVILTFVAIGLGFRPDPDSDGIKQVDEFAPARWLHLDQMPDVLHDQKCLDKLALELPKPVADEEPADATDQKSSSEEHRKVEDPSDLVMDAVLGSNAYQQLKTSTNPEVQKKLLVAKWIFATGMLVQPDFPPTEPYMIEDTTNAGEDGPACTTDRFRNDLNDMNDENE